MVDDEASGVAQAVGAQTRAVTIARHHEEVDVLGEDGDDFALGPSPTVDELGVLAPEPFGRGDQELQSPVARAFLGAARGSVPRKTASQKPGGRRGSDFIDVGRLDVNQGDLHIG